MRPLSVLVLLTAVLLAESEEDWHARGFARIPPDHLRWSGKRTLEWRAVLGSERWLHSGGAHHLAYRPDGRLLISCGGRQACIWEVATGRLVRVLRGRGGEPSCAEWSPDGSWIAVGGSDARVRIHDAATGEERAVLGGFREVKAWAGVGALAISPDGTRLVACGAYDEIHAWSTATWNEVFRRRAHIQGIAAAAFGPDGRWFATVGGDYALRCWDAATGKQRYHAAGHESFVQDLAVSPDGRRLATAGMDDTVRTWDAGTGQPQLTLRGAGHPEYMWTVALSPDGRLLAAGDSNGRITCWDAASGRLHWQTRGHLDEVAAVRFDPGGRRIASTGDDSSVRFFDAPSGREIAPPDRHRLAVNAVAATPDGRKVLSASDDGSVRIWDARSLELLATRRPHAGAEIKALAISPDGKWVVSGAEVLDPKLNLMRWPLGDPDAPPTPLAGHETLVYAVAISPDASRIVSTGGRWVRIWDASDNRLLHTLKGHDSFTTALTIDPNGEWAASGSHDTTVRIWDLRTGRCRHVLTGHKGAVQSLTAAPDGSWLAAGSHGEIKLWHPRSGACLETLAVHEERVWGLAVSADGRWVHSASFDGTLRVVDTASGEEVDLRRIDGVPTAVAVHGDRVWVGCEDASVRGFVHRPLR